jgi:hypothetical protein
VVCACVRVFVPSLKNALFLLSMSVMMFASRPLYDITARTIRVKIIVHRRCMADEETQNACASPSSFRFTFGFTSTSVLILAKSHSRPSWQGSQPVFWLPLAPLSRLHPPKPVVMLSNSPGLPKSQKYDCLSLFSPLSSGHQALEAPSFDHHCVSPPPARTSPDGTPIHSLLLARYLLR